MATQFAPAPSQRCHCSVTVVAAFCDAYDPPVPMRFTPTFAVPVIFGSTVFTGGVGQTKFVLSSVATTNFVPAGQVIAPDFVIELGNSPRSENVPRRPVGATPPALKPVGYALVCVSTFAQPWIGVPPVST